MAKKQNDTALVTEQAAPDMSLAHDSANAPVSIKDVVLKAFQLGERAERDEATSQQTLAYACMWQHAADMRNSDKPAAWSEIVIPKAKAGAAFANRMMDVTVGPRPTKPERGVIDSKVTLAQAQWHARYVSMRRAVDLAAQLVTQCDVSHLDYSEADKVFSVPVDALLLDGQVPFSVSLRKIDHAKGLVPLDGTSYAVTNEADPDKMVTLRANVSRIIEVVKAKNVAAMAKATKANVDAVKAGALFVGQSPATHVHPTAPNSAHVSNPETAAPVIAAATVHGGAIADVQAADRATRQNKVGTTGDLWDCLREASAIIMAVENTHHNRVAWREIPLDVQNALVNIELFIAQAKADDAMPADGHRDEPVMGTQPVTAGVAVTEPETAAIAA